MLVLSRQVDERIMIGDDIVLIVVDIRGDKVRLGIEAPPEVKVHRQEVFDAIAAEAADGFDRAPISGHLAEGGNQSDRGDRDFSPPGGEPWGAGDRRLRRRRSGR